VLRGPGVHGVDRGEDLVAARSHPGGQALGQALATLWVDDSALARPYDLRHAVLSLWLNASAEPAEVAVQVGNSARVLHDTHLHRIDSHEDLVSQRIEDALDAAPGSRPRSQCGKASGYTHLP
jgi:hypothetical protein